MPRASLYRFLSIWVLVMGSGAESPSAVHALTTLCPQASYRDFHGDKALEIPRGSSRSSAGDSGSAGVPEIYASILMIGIAVLVTGTWSPVTEDLTPTHADVLPGSGAEILVTAVKPVRKGEAVVEPAPTSPLTGLGI